MLWFKQPFVANEDYYGLLPQLNPANNAVLPVC